MKARVRSFGPLLFIALLGLAGCAPSTSIVQSWRDPEVSVADGTYNKVLVVCLIKDETTRRIGEDHMVAFLNGHGVASYTLFGDQLEKINEEGMNAKMVAGGVDAVMIMRLVDQSKEQTYVPGTTYPSYYASPYGYYGYSYGYYSTPGYVQTTTIYTVESNLYSTRRGKLIWTGTTSTVDPSDLGRTVDDIMGTVYDRMKRDGLITAAPVAK
ncbi:MAG: hypothetical protein IT229_03145 [Flavobacteriales bacterium]|nr:hypothetical protein [Flavobacteriales bacterium]